MNFKQKLLTFSVFSFLHFFIFEKQISRPVLSIHEFGVGELKSKKQKAKK
jgi:hypothetical protein